jgi:preprotein translocase subunit SecA
MRIFGSEKLDSMLKTLGLKEGEAIAHRWINKALEKAQQKVEARNYDIRKSLLKFDDVMNDQRKVIFDQRTKIMESDDIKDFIKNMKIDTLDNIVLKNIPKDSYFEQWNLSNLEKEIKEIFGIKKDFKKIAKKEGVADEEIKKIILNEIEKADKDREKEIGSKNFRTVEKRFLLPISFSLSLSAFSISFNIIFFISSSATPSFFAIFLKSFFIPNISLISFSKFDKFHCSK